MAVTSNLNSWQGFYAGRLNILNNATDQTTRSYFEAELKIVRSTMKAMNLEMPAQNLYGKNKLTEEKVSVQLQSDEFLIVSKPKYQSLNISLKANTLSRNLNQAQIPYWDYILSGAKTTGNLANLIAAFFWNESKGNHSANTTNGENGLTDFGVM